MVTININQAVRVKLTEVGLAELKRQNDEMKAAYPKIDFEPMATKVDSDGYTVFQLHTLMYQLGHLLVAGGEMPFDSEIQFDYG